MNQQQRQEVFDRVAAHLLKQGKRASLNGTKYGTNCAYRGVDGTKCAIGCLISDEYYKEEFEGKGIGAVADAVERSLGVVLDKEDQNVLDDMQFIHDNRAPASWAKRLKFVAKKYGLQFNQKASEE